MSFIQRLLATALCTAVGGQVTGSVQGPIGVSVEDGGIRYSTIADPSGTWALVFRHTAVDFTVSAWLLDKPSVVSRHEESLPISSP